MNPNPRIFRHKNGFFGNVESLSFYEDGRVIGNLKNGEQDSEEYTHCYNIEFALKQVAKKQWIEVTPDPDPNVTIPFADVQKIVEHLLHINMIEARTPGPQSEAFVRAMLCREILHRNGILNIVNHE